MSIAHQGDLHNFGQSVHAVERASGTYFQKPRSVYWEWLFFGKSSPLAPLFVKDDKTTASPSANLFHLDVEMREDFSGESRRVAPSLRSGNENQYAFSLGVLLAYCYVFGIRDLHRHNLVPTESHLQVVDAEVVLVKLLLPNETLLLPFKGIGSDLAAVSHLGLDPATLPPEAMIAILKGYCDTFQCILKNLPEIQKVFSDRRDELIRAPVRHIMRDTVHYRQWKTIQPEVPFFADELEQLERGDIPYFFKFIGNPNLYKYINATGGVAQVIAPADFAKAIARDATDPEILLQHDRVERNLFPTGLLYLLKCLWTTPVTTPLQLDEMTIIKSDGAIRVVAQDRVYQAVIA